MTETVWPFRPEAIAAYRRTPQDRDPEAQLRPSRWPVVALVVLLAIGLAFAMSVRVARVADGTVMGASGPFLVAVVPGRLDPVPAAGAPARLSRRPDQPLRVARVEAVTGAADARRWGIPDAVPRPATVVLLTGGPDQHGQALGQVSIRVANPTLLRVLPSLASVRR
jgi:hypothetical protein